MIQIPLTPEAFAAKSVQLEKEQDLKLTGNEGTISKMGVTAAYKYTDGLLSVTILEKPFFVTEQYCEEQLKKMMGAA